MTISNPIGGWQESCLRRSMILTDYKGANLFDELVDASGKIRPYYRNIADKLSSLGNEELSQKLRSLELLFLKQGITFTVYGDEKGTERVFPFDPFPRVVPAGEWEHIEAGLVQRITALNLFLYDVYHEQRILKDGIIPPEVVFGASHYRPEFVGVSVPKDAYIHVCGTDLIRDRDGRYLVLYVAVDPVNMRKQFNGLSAHAEQALGENPKSGALFGFTNKNRDRLESGIAPKKINAPPAGSARPPSARRARWFSAWPGCPARCAAAGRRQIPPRPRRAGRAADRAPRRGRCIPSR